MTRYDYQDEAVNAVLDSKEDVGKVILPTGTGKSRIQGRIIAESMIRNPGFGIYMILTPRILLTNQLMKDVAKILLDHDISFKRVLVHSGRCNEEEIVDEISSKENFIDLMKLLREHDSVVTTSSKAIEEQIANAKKIKCPVFIASTYHSMLSPTSAVKRLNTAFDIVLCDEAHTLVNEEFNGAIREVYQYTGRLFHFTATERHTDSDDGLGMNNPVLYGNTLCQRSSKEMVEQGYVVPPRIHLVEVDGEENTENAAKAIVAAFAHHKTKITPKQAAKMLICHRGTADINDISQSAVWRKWCSNNSDVTTYDISATLNARIDGAVVDRNEFLETLKADPNQAIVSHIRILTEGIDVPGFTSVYIGTNMQKTRFKQAFGRAARLHEQDRAELDAGILDPKNRDQFAKPWAYIIIPIFNNMGEDRKAAIMEMVEEMREEYHNIGEIVVIRQKRGMPEEEIIDRTTQPTKKNRKSAAANIAIQIFQSIENEKAAGYLDSKTRERMRFITTDLMVL
jgi:superfamily II DNA or RNA helicase